MLPILASKIKLLHRSTNFFPTPH